MLVIDGVKYELWIPPNEDEFEQVVKEHTQDIFGEQSIYIDIKQKLKSVSGIGSIPDGFAIILRDAPDWHVIEMELSSHPLYDHIVSQVSRFISGVSNPNIQRRIANTIDEEISKDDFLRLKMKKEIEPIEIYKFLADIISKPPILTVIVEKDTQGLREALSTLAHPHEKNVVEFQTFIREGAGLAVHAHLFESLFQRSYKRIANTKIDKEKIITRQNFEKRVTAKDLIDANILKVGQIIYGWHHNRKYEGKVLSDGSIELLHTGKKFPSLNAAVYDIKGAEDAWRWWLTNRENGSEYVLDKLRKEYRTTHPNNV